jgi:predicted anti-sigma-YlaC factor YlaD
MSTTLPEICNRTRQHVSLRLDTEVSELEEALGAAHLRRCAACRVFALDLEALTETLRAAPLAKPSVEFQLPRRPARIGVARAGTAAAAAITVAIAVSGVVALHSSPSQISASDIQNARERLILKEHLIEELEGNTARPAQQVPRGVKAAKNATL